MVRRSPQKKKNRPGSAKPDAGAAPPAEAASISTNEEAAGQTAVNWLSASGPAPALAPEPEPWTPTNRKSEWGTARSPMRSPTKPLEQQVSSLQAQREAADADLWNARVELQDHAQQKEADQERISRLTAELMRLRADYEHDSQAMDELRSREEELQTHLERERAKAARERQAVREQLEDRDGFIENLQSQLDELREELKATTRAAALLRRQTADDTSGDVSSGAGDITSITVDSDVNLGAGEAADVPQTPGASELLSQTHHARQQRSLRAALQKQRLENFQLKQQLAELRGAPVPRWEDEEAEQRDEERQRAADESHAATSRPSSMHGDSSAFFTENSAGEVPQIPAGVPLSEDFVDEAQLQRDAEHLNLAVVPEAELAELRSRHSAEASLDSLTAHLRSKYDAHVVPSDELDALRNPGMDMLHDQASAINHRLVPIREYEEMRSTQTTRAKLKLSDEELKLAYELLRGRRRSKSKVNSHVLQDLARNQALGLAPDVSHYYGDARDPSVSPSRSTPGRHHRTASHSSSVSDAESGYGDPQYLTDGVGTALRQIAQNHGFELVSDTVAGSRELAKRHGLVTVPQESLAILSNSKIVSGEPAPASLQVNDVMLALSRDEANRIQAQLAEPASISKEELAELQRRAYTPTSTDLTEQAAALGMAVLPLEAVAKMKGELRQRSVPDASTVAVMAEKAGLQVIPQHPTLDELRDLAPEDAVLVERDTWAALEYPEPATLRRLAKVHGLAVLPESEVERLQQNNVGSTADSGAASASASAPSAHELSVDQLREAAQTHDLVVLGADDYREILASRQTRDFSHLPMAARTEHFEKLIRSSQEARTSGTSPRGSPSASSLGSLSDRITRLGFVPVEQEEYKRLLASQKVYEPTKSDILRAAKQLGLAVMPVEDALRLRSSHWNSPTKSSADNSFTAPGNGSPRASTSGRAGSPLKASTRDLDDEDFEGFKAVPAEYLAVLRRIVEHPTRSDVEGLARKAGLTVGGTSLSDEEVIQKAKELGLVLPPSKDELLALAKAEGLVEPLADDEILARARILGLSDPLSREGLLEAAKSHGLVEPPTDAQHIEKGKSLGLVKPLTELEILEKAKSKGLVEPLTDDQVLEQAKRLGLVEPLSDDAILARAEHLGYAKPLTNAEIRERGLTLGLVEPLSDAQILEKAKSLGLVKPPTDAEILAKAKDLGLVVPPSEQESLDRGKELGLVHPLSESAIVEKAQALGLAKPLTDDEIVRKAKELGLAEPYTETELIKKGKSLGLVEPLSDDDVVAKAQTLGLVHNPSDAEVLQKAKALGLVEPLSDKDLAEKAKTLGLFPVPSDAETLARAKSLGLKEPMSDSEIAEVATQRLGLVQPPSESDITAKAQELGLVFPLSESKLLESAKSKGLVEPYTDSQVRDAAKRLGLIDPLNESDLRSAAKAKGLVEPYSDDQIREAARKLGLVEPPDENDLLASAKSRGLVVEPYSETDIREAAKRLGLVDPLSESDLLTAAKSKGLVEPYSESQVRDAAKKLGLVEPPSENEVLRAAKAKGLVEPYSESQIRGAARQLGLMEPLGDAELIQAAKSKGLVEPYSDKQIADAAERLGLAKPLSEDELIKEAKSKGLVEPYSDAQIRGAAEKLGLVEPPSENEVLRAAKAKGLVEPYSESQIRGAARQLGLMEPLGDAELLQAAKAKGLVEPYSDKQIADAAEKLGLAKPLSEDELIKEANSKGLVEPYSDAQIRGAAEKLGLTEPLSESELLDVAKAKGLVEPYSEGQVREAAKTLGMVESSDDQQIVQAAKARGLTEPLSEAQILELAKARGLAEPLSDAQIVEAGKSRGLIEPLTKSQIIEAAKLHGLVEPPTVPEIKEAAQKHGLVAPYSDSEVVAAAKKLGLIEPLTDEQVLQRAKETGFAALADSPTTSRPSAADAAAAGLPRALTDGELTDLARSRGFTVTANGERRDAESANEARTHSRQTSEVPSGAAAAAIAPRSSGRAQKEAGAPVSAPVARKPVGSAVPGASPQKPQPKEAPPIPERVRTDRGRSPSLSRTGVPHLAPTSVAGSQSEMSEGSRGDPSVVYGPGGPGKLTASGLPQRLGGSPVRRSLRHHEPAAASRSPTKGMSRSNTSSSLHGHSSLTRASHSTAKADPLNLPLPRSNSYHPHGAPSRYAASLAESAGSSWAVETVTGEAAEHNMSQIIVGEVLHKYTSGFNFEGITGGRHKRYFWFRPESMSIYWHRENPHFLASLYGPAKFITLVGVEEIPDRNPIPAGLYHRSILLKGRERTVRVTCSTAARHQLWVSSLRYVLAERNRQAPQTIAEEPSP